MRDDGVPVGAEADDGAEQYEHEQSMALITNDIIVGYGGPAERWRPSGVGGGV